MARRRGGKSAKERKEARKQEERRGQQLIIAVVVAVVVVFGGIVFAVGSVPASVVIPDDISRYDNYLTSTTDEGFALLGNPDAPVTVREFSSFGCPACLEFHESTTYDSLLELVAEGVINFVFIPLNTGNVSNPEGASRAALCAGEQGQFWQMHDVLFEWQETYGSSAFQDGRLRTGVSELGMDVGQFTSCFNSNTTNAVIATAQNEGTGVGTPTIEVNGVIQPNTALATIEQAINSQLTGTEVFEPGIITDGEVETDEAEETDAETEATEEADASDDTETEAESTEEAEETEAETEEADDSGEEGADDDDAEAESTEEAEDS